MEAYYPHTSCHMAREVVSVLGRVEGEITGTYEVFDDQSQP